MLVVFVTLELATAERRTIETRRHAERLSMLDAVEGVVQAVTRHTAVIRNAAKSRDHRHIRAISTLSKLESVSNDDWKDFDRALNRSADAEQKFSAALAAARA